VVLGTLIGLLFGAALWGLVLAVVTGVAAAVAAWRWSDVVALRRTGARPVADDAHPRLHNLVEGLCVSRGLPKPRLHVIDDAAPNSYAVGRSPRRASLVVTTGLLDVLTRIELEGVLGHELSHIKNHDTVVSTLGVTLVGGLATLSSCSARYFWLGGRESGTGPGVVTAVAALPFAALSPAVLALRDHVLGPRREYDADLAGVELTRYPPGLAAALDRIGADPRRVRHPSVATAHLWLVDPWPVDRARSGRFARWYDSHPDLEERVDALREL
jgi:heat shock protein HtpX